MWLVKKHSVRRRMRCTSDIWCMCFRMLPTVPEPVPGSSGCKRYIWRSNFPPTRLALASYLLRYLSVEHVVLLCRKRGCFHPTMFYEGSHTQAGLDVLLTFFAFPASMAEGSAALRSSSFFPPGSFSKRNGKARFLSRTSHAEQNTIPQCGQVSTCRWSG